MKRLPSSEVKFQSIELGTWPMLINSGPKITTNRKE
jgi:hypothetical protein